MHGLLWSLLQGWGEEGVGASGHRSRAVQRASGYRFLWITQVALGCTVHALLWPRVGCALGCCELFLQQVPGLGVEQMLDGSGLG